MKNIDNITPPLKTDSGSATIPLIQIINSTNPIIYSLCEIDLNTDLKKVKAIKINNKIPPKNRYRQKELSI